MRTNNIKEEIKCTVKPGLHEQLFVGDNLSL